MDLYDLAGCQEQECGAYIDTFWGSSLPDELYGLCTGIDDIHFHLTNITTDNISSFLKLILILMGTIIAETR